jgi:hypothetical protein
LAAATKANAIPVLPLRTVLRLLAPRYDRHHRNGCPTGHEGVSLAKTADFVADCLPAGLDRRADPQEKPVMAANRR